MPTKQVTERNWRAYERWARTYDTDPNPQLELEYTFVLQALAVRSGDLILDAACGTGRYAEAFARAGAKVVGCDFSEAMLSLARSKVPAAHFIVADLTKQLPFPDGTFDKIVCAQALRHLSDVRETFLEFARLLRPGGQLVFSVSHPEMDWSNYDLKDPPEFILSQEADIYPHTIQTYVTAMQLAGLAEQSFKDLTVSTEIAHLLTPHSYKLVEGRPQILLGLARRAA